MSILSSVFGFMGDNIISLVGGVWALIGLVVTYLAKNYLVPLVQVEKHRRYARWVAAIADEVTDDLVARYPNKAWLGKLDAAVDQIMEICGIDEDVARRAIRASSTRKE